MESGRFCEIDGKEREKGGVTEHRGSHFLKATMRNPKYRFEFITKEDRMTDQSSIIVALVLTALFVSAVVWMEIHARRTRRKGSISAADTREPKNRGWIMSDDPAMRKPRQP